LELTRPTAMICSHCEQNERPIKLVVYSLARNEFQFMCGEADHTEENTDPIHVDHVFNDDHSLVPFAFIRRPFVAERANGKMKWLIEFLSEEDLN